MTRWVSGAAACAAALLVGLGTAPALADEHESDRPFWLENPVLEAIGRADMEVPPDRALFSVTFMETDRDAGDAAAAASDRARLATAAVRQRGGEGVEVRSNVSIQPIYREYRDREGVRQSSEREDQIDSYVARVTLSVTLKDIARAPDARAAALAAEPEDSSAINYTLQSSTDMQRRVFEAAAQDAARRARMAASAAGAQLGSLLVLQEGRGPCLGDTGYGARGFAPPPPPPPPPAPMQASEDISVTGAGGRVLTMTQEQIERLQLPSDPSTLTLRSEVCAVYAIGR